MPSTIKFLDELLQKVFADVMKFKYLNMGVPYLNSSLC
jgi:hypothetical protein